MSIRPTLFRGAIAAAFLGVMPLGAGAEKLIISHSKDVVVVLPAALPSLAQRHGIAFRLYSESGDGSCYLYIEQHEGERLLVLDVTDPTHIKQVKAVSLAVPGPFDFVRELRPWAILVQFRNNLGLAVLDLRKPKTPQLRPVSGLQYPRRTESLGDSAFLMVDEQQTDVPVVP
jgi:hypothetical protein